MRAQVDATHDPELRSWVRDANGHAEFPIQNLPFGVVRVGGGEPAGCVAIGEHALSLGALGRSGLLRGEALEACRAGEGGALNALLALGAGPRKALRLALSELLAEGAVPRPELLFEAAACEVLLPARVGDFTDFYAGIHHAENVGRLFRPENPLLPNYKWVPIGYHGRSSSVRASGEAVRRPKGQHKHKEVAAPTYRACERLDFELELGIWIGPGNEPGEGIAIGEAEEHVGGFCLLNDWSARDVQAWEYQPLGPFLGKSFHTSVSGWIVTPEALAPFRQAQRRRAEGDPEVLPYLYAEADQAGGALGVELEVYLSSAKMPAAAIAPQQLSRVRAEDLYWTVAQMVTHHASNGCNLRPGDLLGTGTISSAGPEGLGSLLELTRGGVDPLALRSGETRGFLEDGDEVIFLGHARREGFVSIGFGECRAVVLPAK